MHRRPTELRSSRDVFVVNIDHFAFPKKREMHRSMVVILSLTLFAQCLLGSRNADLAALFPSSLQQASSAPVNSSFPELSPSNDTLSAQDFLLSISYGNDDLDRESVLMNAVEALAILSRRDLHAQEEQLHSYLMQYPYVAIDVLPFAPATTIENSNAVHCLYWGIYRVVADRSFKNANIDCIRDKVVVAQIFVWNPFKNHSLADLRGNISIGNSTLSLDTTARKNGIEMNFTSSPSSLTSTSFDGLSDSNVRTVFQFQEEAKSLMTYDVFMVVMRTLTIVAQWPSTDAVSNLASGFPPNEPYDAKLVFPSGITIRTTPPFYEYEHIIEATRRIPEWMIMQKRFAEINIEIWVDNIHLGSAELQEGHLQSALNDLGLIPVMEPNLDVKMASA